MKRLRLIPPPGVKPRVLRPDIRGMAREEYDRRERALRYRNMGL